MDANGGGGDHVVSLSVIQFVDRIIQTERKLVETGFERSREALAAHETRDDILHKAEQEAIVKLEEDVDHRLKEARELYDQRTQMANVKFENIQSTLSKCVSVDRFEMESKDIHRRLAELDVAKGGYRGSYVGIAIAAVILGEVITMGISLMELMKK